MSQSSKSYTNNGIATHPFGTGRDPCGQVETPEQESGLCSPSLTGSNNRIGQITTEHLQARSQQDSAA